MPLIISPVFALRPHGQLSKTSGQIGVYECKHPACHTVSVSESVDVDKKQLDGDSQSSQTPHRHGFWSSLPSYRLSIFVPQNREEKKTDEGSPSCHMTCTLLSFEFFSPSHWQPTPQYLSTSMDVCTCSSAVASTLCWKGAHWRGLVSIYFLNYLFIIFYARL